MKRFAKGVLGFAFLFLICSIGASQSNKKLKSRYGHYLVGIKLMPKSDFDGVQEYIKNRQLTGSRPLSRYILNLGLIKQDIDDQEKQDLIKALQAVAGDMTSPIALQIQDDGAENFWNGRLGFKFLDNKDLEIIRILLESRVKTIGGLTFSPNNTSWVPIVAVDEHSYNMWKYKGSIKPPRAYKGVGKKVDRIILYQQNSFGEIIEHQELFFGRPREVKMPRLVEPVVQMTFENSDSRNQNELELSEEENEKLRRKKMWQSVIDEGGGEGEDVWPFIEEMEKQEEKKKEKKEAGQPWYKFWQ